VREVESSILSTTL